MTERVKRCVETGSVVALFPLLKDWSREELRALLDDLDNLYEERGSAIEEAHKKTAFLPENFFSQSRSKAIDTAAKELHMASMAMASEIASVALYYLEAKEKGPCR